MSRYIDADKFIERLNASPAFPNMGTDGYFLLGVVEDLLKSFPTADVVEVRHGEWNTECKASTSSGFAWYMHTCSTCGYTYKTVVPIGYTYCPNCGAKMDGERREECL